MTESIPPDDNDSPTRSDGEIQAEYDWSSAAPSTAVIQTLAIAVNREPTTIDPLYDSVDPDALDRLICSIGDDSPDGGPSVRFTHDDHEVTVDAAGTVIVRPVESDRE